MWAWYGRGSGKPYQSQYPPQYWGGPLRGHCGTAFASIFLAPRKQTYVMSLVITSRNVLLPAHNEACPATIHVDLASGVVSRVQLLQHGSTADCPDGATFIDYGDLYVLPGLVECVHAYSPNSASYSRPYSRPQCPCPPQRAWPHRLGGFRNRNPGSRFWRCYRGRRHAPQFHSSHHHRSKPRRETASRTRSMLDRCRLLGRRNPW